MQGSRFAIRCRLGCVYLAATVVLLAGTVGVGTPAAMADTDTERPRVGLVLSGGGARGASHVGVLKVLERERIPIDYITGTSMGSIIGGLYASGMSPEEIEAQLVAIDWEAVFDDKVDRKERSFRRKQDDRLWLFGPKPGVSGGKLKLPPGLVQGQKISMLLTSLALPVADIDSFDDLPIPFRAVAADIQTGERVVLDSGNLAKAIRSSMSVPAAMAPVDWDGRRLVDGGIASNMPVIAARDMGAEIIIGVDLGAPLSDNEIGESVLGIVDQLTALLVRDNVERELALLTDTDIIIRPDLGDITSGDFERVGEAIPTGVVAAEAKLDELRRLSLSETDFATHLAARGGADYTPPVIEFIDFDNESSLPDEFLEGRLARAMQRDRVVGSPLDADKVEKGINELYGLEVFAHVSYEVVQRDGQHGLHVRVLPKTWGPTYAQLGAKWNSSMNGDSVLTVAASLLKTEINSWNAEWRTTLALGEEPGLLTDFYQPLGYGGRWFVGGKALISTFDTNIFAEGTSDVTERYRIRRYGGTAYVGREFGHWGRIQFDYTGGTGDRRIRIGDPATPDEDFDVGELTLRVDVDRLDDLYFPTRGHLGMVKYRYGDEGIGASADFEQLMLKGVAARSVGNNAFVLSADYRSTVSGTAPLERLFRAGGLFNLSGFEFNELSGQNFAQLMGIYRRDFIRTGILDLSAGVSVEYGNVWQDKDDIDFDDGLLAGSLFFGANTVLGPAYLGYGLAEGSDGTFYIYVGSIRNTPALE